MTEQWVFRPPSNQAVFLAVTLAVAECYCTWYMITQLMGTEQDLDSVAHLLELSFCKTSFLGPLKYEVSME